MITGHTSKMDKRLIDQMIKSSGLNEIMTVDHVSNKISKFLSSDDLNNSYQTCLSNGRCYYDINDNDDSIQINVYSFQRFLGRCLIPIEYIYSCIIK